MSRKSTEAIVIHCTATLQHQPFTVEAIRQMHLARGFKDIGYAFLIGLKGETWEGRKPIDAIGAHVKDFNDRTIGISYVGGLRTADAAPMDTRTVLQVNAMIALCRRLLKIYPNAVILGHRDFSPDLDGDGAVEQSEWMKSCPCFNAGAWAVSVGLPGGYYDNRSKTFKKLPVSLHKAPTEPVQPVSPFRPPWVTEPAKTPPPIAPVAAKPSFWARWFRWMA